MRNPYKNIDLEVLVKEHYGVEGYDPNVPLPSLPTAKSQTTGGYPSTGTTRVVEVTSNSAPPNGSKSSKAAAESHSHATMA
jgi:hypothetical protein